MTEGGIKEKGKAPEKKAPQAESTGRLGPAFAPLIRELRFDLHLMSKSITSIVGLGLFAFLCVIAAVPWLFAEPTGQPDPYVLPFNQYEPDPLPPGTAGHPFGSGRNGADIYYGIVWGARVSMTFAVEVVLLGVDAPGLEPHQLRLRGRRLERLEDVARFVAGMDEDFNTREAVASLFDLANFSNASLHKSGLSRGEREASLSAFRELGGVLGLLQDKGQDVEVVGGLVQLLQEVRQESRAKKDYATSDKIRDRLKQIGVVTEDSAGGFRWKIQK